MNRCKTCKWWTKSKDHGGFCENKKLREWNYTPEVNAPDELVYSYNEGGSFWTGPEFGCVHWEEGE